MSAELSTRAARRRRFAFVLCLLVGLTAAHFLAPVHAHDLHAFLFKATFLPLVLAGLWFGLRGAAMLSGVTAVIYVVHIVVQLAGEPLHDVRVIALDVLLIVAMSLTAGALADRRAAALRQERERAEQLEEATRVLLRAEEELRRAERLRALGELAAGLAHEIRNPLGGIRGAGEILAREGTTPEAREEFRGVLLSEIERLDRVVENFLRFARTDEPAPARVPLGRELEAVRLLLDGVARRAGVEVEVRCDGALDVRANPDLLRQVLLNVALNALQAMTGGGRLTIEAEAGDPVRVRVTDTGHGIPEAVRGRVFDPFFTTREGGSGLGLATSHRVLEGLGGAIRVARTGPEGTQFEIELPAAGRAA